MTKRIHRADRRNESIYSDELADRICEQIALGKSMRTIARTDNMPALSTMMGWVHTNPSFAAKYDLARQQSLFLMAEDILELSDQDEADVQRNKLQVDTRKWLLSRLKPGVYGDRQQVDVNDITDRSALLEAARARLESESP